MGSFFVWISANKWSSVKLHELFKLTFNFNKETSCYYNSKSRVFYDFSV